MPFSTLTIERFEKSERTPVPEVVAALRNVGPLEGMDQRDYEWLAMNGREFLIEAGDLMFQQDQPAEYMSIILRGEIQVRRVRGGETNLFVGRVGEITGLLPYSRMKGYGGDGTAVAQTWVLGFHKSEFPRLLENVPTLRPRIVGILLDRVREVTRMEQQAEKLTSLNKLAGNLAHELNNPASAAQRSASHLLQELSIYGHQKFELGLLCLSQDKLTFLRNWEDALHQRVHASSSGAVEQSDNDADIEAWLESHNILDSIETSTMLAECGVTRDDLNALSAQIQDDALSTYLAQFASSLRTRRMTEAILNSTTRIFEIINAIKDYSYLDQAPLQQVLIPHSMRNALAMLQSRLGKVELVQNFPPKLEAITAFGMELNQVWTALFENALDAMEDVGRLEISAHIENEWMIIEVRDNGTGIEPENISRVFEPFFTTKPPGKGLGLGLDTAMRIVRKHRGILKVESVPGNTCFQVRLPLEQGRAY
jgi:signal transduction histidine kinase